LTSSVDAEVDESFLNSFLLFIDMQSQDTHTLDVSKTPALW